MVKLSIILPLAVALSADMPKFGEALPSMTRVQASSDYQQLQKASEYIRRFGYHSDEDSDSLSEGIRRFQEDIGLPPTGKLDETTIDAMDRPRCTIIENEITVRRRKRFATAQTSRWDKMTPDNVLKLKWFISHYTKDMSRQEIRTIVRKSFSLWSTQTTIHSMPSVTLLFEEAQREADADITVLWAEGDHGDAYKFDGTGNQTNILAHTFYPTYQETGTLNGDIHLDDSEKWISDEKSEGTTFSNVFIHEIGHSLGLGHSKRPDAIMFPIYKKDVLEHASFDLDDKCALNWNYIGPSNLCLFVWLMSEVLPRQIEHKAAMEANNNISVISSSSTNHQKESTAEKVIALRKQLHGARIPQCESDNNVRERFEALLQRKLGFALSEAIEYSEVVCNFLSGLQQQTRETFEGPEAIEALTVKVAQDYMFKHTLGHQKISRRARRRLSSSKHKHRRHHSSLFNKRFFDKKFFDHFFSLYMS